MTVGAMLVVNFFRIHTTVKIEQYSYELLSTSETKHLTTVGADISALISSSLF